MKALTVDLSPRQLTLLRKHALRMGVSVSELAAEAVRAFLATSEPPAAADAATDDETAFSVPLSALRQPGEKR